MVCCSFVFLFSSLALPLTCWNALFIIFFPLFLKKQNKKNHTYFHLKKLIFLIFRISKALPSPKRLSFPRWAHGCLRGKLVFPGATVPRSRRQHCQRVTRSRTPCELLLQVMPPLEVGMEPKLEAVAFLQRKCLFDLSLSLPSYVRFWGEISHSFFSYFHKDIRCTGLRTYGQIHKTLETPLFCFLLTAF